MFRKFAIALAATIAIGGAAVSVGATPAAAFGHGGHGGGHGGWHGGSHGWHGGHGGWRGARGFAFYGAPAYAYGGGCMVRRWVNTPWGPRARLVNRCY